MTTATSRASQLALPLPLETDVTEASPATTMPLDHRLAIAVSRAVAEAPPLTPEQRDRIVQLLQQSQTSLEHSSPRQLSEPA